MLDHFRSYYLGNFRLFYVILDILDHFKSF